jgi:signal transduction histidine kinase
VGPGPDKRSSRFLFTGYLVVVVSFLAAAIYTTQHIRKIDAASDEIVRDAMPTIRCLAEARQSVGQLQLALSVYLAGDGTLDPTVRAAIEAPLRAVDEQVDTYLALPLFPGERPLWEDVQRATHELQNATRRMLGQADASDQRLARETGSGQVIPAARQLHEALSRDIDFNAQNGTRLAESIKAVRVRGQWLGVSLSLLCGLVALLASLIVNGQIRRRDTLVAEHARLLEERARELESFSGRVAHDIMNPAGGAQLALELEIRRLRAAGALPHDNLLRAQRSLQRIQALVVGLLGFARAGARPAGAEAADVVEVIQDVLSGAEPRASAAGLTLAAELSSGAVACAKGVLLSLVANLVDNAIKYARGGGRVVVRAAVRSGTVRVEVEDDGPGLPPELAGRVFEPFVRGAGAETPGLGLGLATVRRLADAHGGCAGVRSGPGPGCTFWFELPRATAPAASSVASAAGREAGVARE